MNAQINEGWMDGRLDRWVDGSIEGWMDKRCIIMEVNVEGWMGRLLDE